MSRLVKRAGGHDLRFRCGLGSLNDGVETRRVGNSDFAQHFSIQGDVGLLACVDELTVPYAALPAGCAQSRNPQAAEIAFAAPAADSSIDFCTDAGFFGQTIEPACGTTMALCCFEDSFLCPMSCGTFSNSWHISFPLKIFDSTGLLAAAEWNGT
jgi:hypothetical protein